MATKPIKEVYTDIGGNTTVEYSDDSTRKFNVEDVVTAQVNAVTGGVAAINDTDGSAITLSPGKKRLVIFGSSNGAGVGASTYTGEPSQTNGWTSPSTSWAGLLKADLVTLGWQVWNRSMSGTGTTAAISRFYTDVAVHRPSHVIICMHPINDGLDAGLILRNTIELCRLCDSIGAVPILRGAYMTPGLTSVQLAEMLSLNQQLDKLGRHRIDHFSTLGNPSTGAFITTGFDSGDGLHPNDAGYLELYREIDQAIFLYGSSITPTIQRSGSWLCDLGNGNGRAIMVSTSTNLPKPLLAFTMRARVKGFIGAPIARAFLCATDNIDGTGIGYRLRNSTGAYGIADSGVVGTDSAINPTIEALTRDLVLRYNPVTNVLSMWIDGTQQSSGVANQPATLHRLFTFGSRGDIADAVCKGYTFSDMALWNVALSDRTITDMYRSNKLQRGGLVFAADLSNGPINTGIVSNHVPNSIFGKHAEATWAVATEI